MDLMFTGFGAYRVGSGVSKKKIAPRVGSEV